MAGTGRISKKLGGYGNLPGVGKVKPPKKFNYGPGGQNNSLRLGMQAAVNKPSAFKPSLPGPASVGAPALPGPPRELPVDPVYDATIGGLTKRRDDTLTEIGDTQTRGLADFGYNATFDDQGGLTGLSFDANNPNSRAALLKRHALQARSGTQNGMAARGQLYSGSLINAQNENDFQAQGSEDRLKKQLGDFIAGLTNRRRTAGTDYETGAGIAYGERVGRVNTNPLYDPEAASTPVPISPQKPKVVKVTKQPTKKKKGKK